MDQSIVALIVATIVVACIVVYAVSRGRSVRIKSGRHEVEISAKQPNSRNSPIVQLTPTQTEPVSSRTSTPPEWTRAVEHDHDELFGVDQHIDFLKAEISKGANRSITVVCGDGGTGKTAIAYDAVRAVSEASSIAVSWASARQLDDVANKKRSSLRLGTTEVLRELCDQLNLGRPSDSLLDETLVRGVREIAEQRDIVLVVDNIESRTDLGEILTFFAKSRITAAAHILITTRPRVDIAKALRRVDVNQRSLTGLDLANGRRLLRHTGRAVPALVGMQDARLDPIVNVVDGNPYLIKIVTQRLCYSATPLDRLLTEIESVNETKLSSGKDLGNEIRDYMFQFAIEQLDEMVGESARSKLLGVFCSEPQGSRLTYDRLLEQSQLAEPKFKDTLDAAVQLSLARSDDLNERFSIHSLLHSYSSGAK